MKNTIFILAAIVLGTVACNERIDNPKSKSDFSSISKEKKDKKKTMKIVGSDLLGALAGAATGASLGGPGGAVIGAVVGGAGASLKEAGSSIYNAGNSNTGNANADGVNFESFISNQDNSQDAYGQAHYQLSNDFIKAIDNGEDIQDFYSFGFNSFCQMFGYNHNDLPFYDLAAFNGDVNFTQDTINGVTVTDKLTAMRANGKISLRVLSKMLPYVTALEAIDDISSFINYSIDQEQLVADDNTIEVADKAMILVAMATARYGVQYWSEIVDN